MQKLILPELTYKIAGFKVIPNYNTDEVIDWAYEMIDAGFDAPHLYMLTSLSKPTNYFEAVEYLKPVFKELNLILKEDDEAVISYAKYYVQKLSLGKDLYKNLESLYALYMALDYHGSIDEFFHLHCAWWSLKNYEGDQYEWPGATIENIESIIIKISKDCLERNIQYYIQPAYP